MIEEIRQQVSRHGVASRAAISEHHPLLRTIQFVVCGYHSLVDERSSLPQKSRCRVTPVAS
jgi:hypothetical protein